MKPNFLPIAIKNSGIALEDVLPRVIAAPPTLKFYLYVCQMYRRLAAGSLLASSDPRPFYGYLFKSARAFQHFLQIAPPDQKLTSKAEPFFDAVACRDDDAAKTMASLCPATPDTTREYEEDFLYLRLLMAHFYGGVPRNGLQAELDRFAELTAENPDPHIPLCRGLLEADQQLFDEGLAAVLEQKLGAYKQARKEESLHPDEASTTAHVSTEILALLELAGRVGLKVKPDYPLAPGVARRFHLRRLPAPDSWRIPERFRSLPELRD
ncbi:Imm49 family immunity protein [Archangium lansingense]|uniref:Imm49 family immunity protein n=1 Tax=Archangium lansingense TaxID=2995310 RepID=A0ABT4ALQ9_9BACT|nr:Imm49 family immunity protein [Archangium lansinium]MCY1082652.1 Imm49 family immunity protein [Archangium lansinium]